jgi:hypothetical protein
LAMSSSLEPLARSPITALPAIILRNWWSGTRSLPRPPRSLMGLFCKGQAVSSESRTLVTKDQLTVASPAHRTLIIWCQHGLANPVCMQVDGMGKPALHLCMRALLVVYGS